MMGIDVVIVAAPGDAGRGDTADRLASFRQYLDDLIDGILSNYAPVRDSPWAYNFVLPEGSQP